VAAPEPARAYCRATTCDPSRESCAEDRDDCLVDGFPVYWGTDCISVSVQADGAPNAGIDYAAARASVERAFAAWMNVTCPGGGNPSIRVKITDPVTCSSAEYNTSKRNANIILFRDDSWPYAGTSQDALGYTRIHFAPATGELYDVDIELNAVAEPLAVGRAPKPGEADLDSIVTHEVGHFLGLNHSLNVEATMVAGYQAGSMELRTPSADDIAGICAIYPPDREPTSRSCAPRHGFSELCGAEQADDTPLDDDLPGEEETTESQGCSVTRGASAQRRDAWVPVALLGLLALRRRRATGRR
jgi:MYXO-CTERM domain-containing protein